MSNKSEAPVNIEEMYKDLLDNDPLKIISSIRYDLDELVAKIISLDSEAVQIVGRKSNLLFRNFTEQIGRTKPVTIADSLKGDLFVSYPHSGNIFLVVDAIHTGEEVSNFYALLQQKITPPIVSKVFSYIGHIDGINKLNDLGLETYCKFLCNSEYEYAESVKKLQVYYQSQIHPIETDVIYDMYTIKNTNKKFILKFIRSSLSKIFDKNIRLKNNKIHAPEYIKQYSYMSSNLKPSSTILKKISVINNLKGVNEIIIMIILKLRFDKDEILLTFKNDMMMDFLTHQSLKTTKKCKFKYVNNETCSHNIVRFDKRKSLIKNMICANCIGNKINETLLDMFKELFINYLKDNNIACSAKRIGNWLNTSE